MYKNLYSFGVTSSAMDILTKKKWCHMRYHFKSSEFIILYAFTFSLVLM